jgi:lipid A 3-O-deacylase
MNFKIMKHKINYKYLLLALFFIIIGGDIYSQYLFTREIGIQSDNDTYVSFSEDKYYTNGLMFFYRFIPEKTNPNLAKEVIEFRLGNKMYTPSSANKPDIADHDRPFAGYLFANAQISKFYENESMLRYGAQLGIMGPASGVGGFQEMMHDFIGWYTVKGWEHQISNNLGINFHGMYSLKIANYLSKQADINLYSFVNIGTIRTNIAVGFWNRISFIELNKVFESNLYGASIVKDRKIKSGRKSDFFFFFKPQLEYHLYDASIQGGMFNNKSPLTFKVEPVQMTFEFGLMFQFERANIWYSVTLQSKDVKNDLVERYAWGSLKLAWMI